MIRILVVDDHQAVRAGLVALLRQEPGFVPAATAATVAEAVEESAGREFDVALVDYHLPDATGVELCRRLRGTPRVLLYSALPSDHLIVAGRVAGAFGVVSKAAPTEELFDALRSVAKGSSAFPPLPRDIVAAAASRLDEDQLPILGMALERVSQADMAAALGVDRDELDRRITRVLSAISPGTAHAA